MQDILKILNSFEHHGHFQNFEVLKNLKPNYFNEKYLIKDRDGNILKKSENLNQLIDKTSWNKLRLIK